MNKQQNKFKRKIQNEWSLRCTGGGHKCLVEGCRSNSKNNIKFHVIPRNDDLARKWLGILNLPTEKLLDFRKKRICSLHFDSQKKKGKKIPKFFLTPPNDYISEQYNKQFVNDMVLEDVGSKTIEAKRSGPYGKSYKKKRKMTIPITKFDVNDFGAQIEVPEVEKDENQELQSTKSAMSATIQGVTRNDDSMEPGGDHHAYHFKNENALDTVKNLHKKVFHLECELEKLKNTVHVVDVDSILRRKHLVNFYTGFESLAKFECFASILEERANHYIRHHKINSIKTLDSRIEIFIFLSRLRVGLLEMDLATRHNVSLSNISKIINFWLNISYSYFKQIPFWPNKKIIQKYMPECFVKKYPSTRVIIDATEIFIEKPSDYNVQSSTYSSYKSHNTAKGLIGITPNGFTSFVSDLYPGRISDKELCIKSGLLNQLEPGDSIMADRGFVILEELRSVDADLNIPPFLNGAAQLNFEDLQKTRDIASIRVHVERMIGNLKSYRILKNAFPNSMSDQLNKYWTVVSLLPNFSRLPLLDR